MDMTEMQTNAANHGNPANAGNAVLGGTGRPEDAGGPAMRAMIFAAGRGTRLKPWTDKLPKALFPVGGQPLIRRVIENLKRFGYNDFVVNIHHFSDQILAYLEANGNFGVSLRISDERDGLCETGGGLLRAEPLLRDSPGGRFLLHNVDILSNLDFSRLPAAVPAAALACVIVSPRKTNRYFLFNEENRLVGWTNLSTGEVRTPFDRLDPASCRKLAFAGLHVVSTGIFDVFREKRAAGAFPIVDFYLSICRDYPIYGLVPENFTVIDMGKPAALPLAEAFLRENARD